MIKSNYPEQFERLWKAFDVVASLGLGEKGSKKLAFAAFKAKNIEDGDVDYLINRLNLQAAIKQDKRAVGQFDPDFQHVERWIRNERFDDEISRPINQHRKAVSRRDQARAAIKALTGESEANPERTGEACQLWVVK